MVHYGGMYESHGDYRSEGVARGLHHDLQMGGPNPTQ